jgi:carboxypeptidase A4
MKPSITSLVLVLNAAVGTLAKVSYDGAKAMRIPVGEDVTPLLDVIEKLSLPTWKGMAKGVPIPNSHVDLVVPADKVAEFEELTADMKTEVMHEDLGLSIAEEGNMGIYAGKVNTI